MWKDGNILLSESWSYSKKKRGLTLKKTLVVEKSGLMKVEVECREKETGSLVGGFDHGLVFQGEDEMEERGS